MGVSQLVNLQLMMFTMMLVGFVLVKIKVLDGNGKRVLTDLVIDLFLPANIIKSFMIEFNMDILKAFGMVMIISVINQIFCLILGRLLYGRMEASESKILRYSTISSNAGFLGNPIAENVFGSMGLAYASIFLIPQRIVIWTAGVTYFTTEKNTKNVIKKVVTHPCIIAVVIGIVFMLCQVSLPDFLYSSLSQLSSACTPMSMIAIGTILAEINLGKFTDKKICFFTTVRLIGIPMVCYLFCMAFNIDPLITGVCVLLSAMPAGTGTALLASKYGYNEEFATKTVIFSTVMSLISTPIWSFVLLQGLK